MTRIVVVTSGKGGVGKTTTSASFSSGLAIRGFKTAVIDFDVGLRNLDLIMGCERRVVYDFTISAPKSVSIMAHTVGDERILTAHAEAAVAAMLRMEQTAATENVARSMEEISALTEENNATIRQVGQSVDEVSSVATELQQLVGKFRV